MPVEQRPRWSHGLHSDRPTLGPPPNVQVPGDLRAWADFELRCLQAECLRNNTLLLRIDESWDVAKVEEAIQGAHR